MKLKAVSGIMLTLLLIIMGFHVIPVLTQPTIKIGVIGPMAFMQGAGMWNGATLAEGEINTLGGVDVGGDELKFYLFARRLSFQDRFSGHNLVNDGK